MTIVEISTMSSLGNKNSLLIRQAEAALKPINNAYPPAKAKATGILSKS